MSDHDEITALILDRHLCLGCTATTTARDRLYVDGILVDLARLGRITSAPGRCRACRTADIVFSARAHDVRSP